MCVGTELMYFVIIFLILVNQDYNVGIELMYFLIIFLILVNQDHKNLKIK